MFSERVYTHFLHGIEESVLATVWVWVRVCRLRVSVWVRVFLHRIDKSILTTFWVKVWVRVWIGLGFTD